MLHAQGTTRGRPRRVDVRVPVDIQASKGIRLIGKTRNVSEGGMFVETALLLPIGSPVRCDLALEQSSIQVFGLIAWSRPRQTFATAGMGIQFIGCHESARLVLRDVVAAGVPVTRLEMRGVAAPIAQPHGRQAVLVALFAGVALATAWLVTVILP